MGVVAGARLAELEFSIKLRRNVGIFNEFNREIWPIWLSRSRFSILEQVPSEVTVVAMPKADDQASRMEKYVSSIS